MQQAPKLGLMGWIKVAVILALVLVAIVAAFFFLGFLLVIGLVVAAVVAGWSAITGKPNPLRPRGFVRMRRQGDWHDASDQGSQQGSHQGAGNQAGPRIIEGNFETLDEKK